MVAKLNESGHLKDIDILVNNAGLVIGVDKIADVTDDAIDTMIDTNIKGLVYATQTVLKGMKERNSGHIINISSISGTQVYPGGGIYCATKHAVDALTRTLRLELVETPIRVTSIDPGIVFINYCRSSGNRIFGCAFWGRCRKSKICLSRNPAVKCR